MVKLDPKEMTGAEKLYSYIAEKAYDIKPRNIELILFLRNVWREFERECDGTEDMIDG